MFDPPRSPPPPYAEHEESQRPPPLPPRPPPLPARPPSQNSSASIASSGWSPPQSSHCPPPPVSHLHPYANPAVPTSSTALLHDPRSSSQASILPPEDGLLCGKRTLLLVYIHGFMGNETSFQSFPAHLHNLLTITLGGSEGSDGYLVHTKVYPKFKTRHQIGVATLEFSKWLSEFENETTDIVLVGHSMGGILAAEVVLLQSPYSLGTRRHPGILGVVAFDSPFLGMHPGIIPSGIASLFRPAPTSAHPTAAIGEESPAVKQELDPLFSQQPQKNFTIISSKKSGTPWESTMRFIGKHHENLTQATAKYLTSHIEFGACLADPIGLTTRYTKIRRLEDGEQLPDGRLDRVRFANYYTISYGCEKAGAVVVKPPLPAEMANDRSFGTVEPGLGPAMLQAAAVGGGEGFASMSSHSRTNSGSSMHSMRELSPGRPSTASSRPESPHSRQQHQDDVGGATSLSAISKPEWARTEGGDTRHRPSVEVIPPTPISPAAPDSLEAAFPPLSSPPTAPSLPEIPEDTDRHLRKALEKENARLWKEHERQLKEHAKLAEGREKAIARVREGREKERAKAISIAEKQRQKVIEGSDKGKDKDESERLEFERWQRKGEKGEQDHQEQVQDCQEQEHDHQKEIPKGEQDYLKQKQDHQKQEHDRQKQEQDRQKQEQDRQKQIRKEEQDRQKRVRKEEQDRQKEEQDRQKQIRKEEQDRQKRIRKEEQDRQKEEQDRQKQIRKEEQDRRKQVQKEEQDHQKQIQKEEQDRQKQIQKEEKDRRKQERDRQKQIQKEEQERQREQRQKLKKKPPRQRKFCITPSKPDQTWTPVEMEGVDEIGAHCGLFFVGEAYAKLVGDVAGRIEEWVGEQQTRRPVKGSSGGDHRGSGGDHWVAKSREVWAW